jgi:endonuclease YncB( thermonuclease family)
MTSPTPPPEFAFRARYRGLWDGDSLYLDVDRGQNLWTLDEKYRLYGVDCPEISRCSEEEKTYGLEAKAYVDALLKPLDYFQMSTHRSGKGKYDYSAEIWIVSSEHGYIYLPHHLIDVGHAVPYNGGKKLPWETRKAIQDAARAAIK